MGITKEETTENNQRTEPSGSKPRWYYNIWVVLFMLFFVLGPFGLPLVWKNPKFSTAVKILLTALVGIYTCVLVSFVVTMYQAVMNEVKQFNSTLTF